MRVLIFLVLIYLALFSSWYWWLPLAIFYSLWRPAYELIALGLLIDVQFGMGTASFPFIYTVVMTALVLGVELLKPYLSYYAN